MPPAQQPNKFHHHFAIDLVVFFYLSHQRHSGHRFRPRVLCAPPCAHHRAQAIRGTVRQVVRIKPWAWSAFAIDFNEKFWHRRITTGSALATFDHKSNHSLFITPSGETATAMFPGAPLLALSPPSIHPRQLLSQELSAVRDVFRQEPTPAGDMLAFPPAEGAVSTTSGTAFDCHAPPIRP
jgi:hypothetical protein